MRFSTHAAALGTACLVAFAGAPAQTPTKEAPSAADSQELTKAVDGIVKEIEKLLADNDLEGAVRAFDAYRSALERGNAPAAVLVTLTKLTLAVDRARVELEAQRRQHLFAAVEALCAQGDTDQAQRKLDQLKLSHPNAGKDPQVSAMQQKIDDARSRRSDKVVAEIRDLLAAGSLKEATTLLQSHHDALGRTPGSFDLERTLTAEIDARRREISRAEGQDVLRQAQALLKQGKLTEAQSLVRSFADRFSFGDSHEVQAAFQKLREESKSELAQMNAARGAEALDALCAELREACGKATTARDIRGMAVKFQALADELSGIDYETSRELRDRCNFAASLLKDTTHYLNLLELGLGDAAASTLARVEQLNRSSALLSAANLEHLRGLMDAGTVGAPSVKIPSARQELPALVEALKTTPDPVAIKIFGYPSRAELDRVINRLAEAHRLMEAGDFDAACELTSFSPGGKLDELRRIIAQEAGVAALDALAAPEKFGARPRASAVRGLLRKLATAGKHDVAMRIARVAKNAVVDPENLPDLPAMSVILQNADDFERAGDWLMTVRNLRKLVASPAAEYLPGGNVVDRLAKVLKDHPEAARESEDALLQEIQALREELRQGRTPANRAKREPTPR